MKVFVCIANNYGMSFNGRSLSKDSAINEKILQIVKNNPFEFIGSSAGSRLEQIIEKLRSKYKKYSKENLYCFISGVDIEPIIDKVDTIYLIHWNRDYPADLFFNKELLKCYSLKSTIHFRGNSHKNITMEEWVK